VGLVRDVGRMSAEVANETMGQKGASITAGDVPRVGNRKSDDRERETTTPYDHR
jgi:hypothetical protein